MIGDFFKKLSTAKERTVKESLSKTNLWQRLTYEVIPLHEVSCSEIMFWKKSILRRMHVKSKHSNPWLIEFTSRVYKMYFCTSQRCWHVWPCLVYLLIRKLSNSKQLSQFLTAGKWDSSSIMFVDKAKVRRVSERLKKGYVDLIVEDRPLTFLFNEKQKLY